MSKNLKQEEPIHKEDEPLEEETQIPELKEEDINLRKIEAEKNSPPDSKKSENQSNDKKGESSVTSQAIKSSEAGLKSRSISAKRDSEKTQIRQESLVIKDSEKFRV